ncbi:MAG TPA: ACP S-malonyltransferase [Dehalococcoidales bacterium]|nr:ACP S-malonyltransferase [Dehalococcoidales bacterium]
MTPAAWVFPGQGSQAVGMGRDLFDNVKSARAVFERADAALGFPLSRLCFEGPEDELRQTINAQPALVTAGIACLEAARELRGKHLPAPAFVAGHSLGEYTALAVAGVFDFPTAVRLARERGRLMHEAGQKRAGAMAAIIGLDEAKLAEVCKESDTVMANINSPGQIVISGAADNVKKAMELATAAGASRAIPLQVSGAFHSPLMQPAADGLAKYVNSVPFQKPAIPVIGNVSAGPLPTPEAVKTELLKQLLNPVQWQRSIEYMVKQGVTTFIEIGPGRVLTGLIRRINKEVATVNIGDLEAIKGLGNLTP